MPPVPYWRSFVRAGKRHGVDPYLLAAQANIESMGFNPRVIACKRHSPAGAKGISQFTDDTARSRHVNPCDIENAINGQGDFMAALLHKFHGSEQYALAGYNAGPGVAVKARYRYPETRRYVRQVLALKLQYKAAA